MLFHKLIRQKATRVQEVKGASTKLEHEIQDALLAGGPGVRIPMQVEDVVPNPAPELLNRIEPRGVGREENKLMGEH